MTEAIEQIVSGPQAAILNSTAGLNLFLAGTGCFSGSTLVRTSNGLKRIDSIKRGDKVLTLNEAKKIPEYKEVIQRFIYKTGEIKQNCIIFVLLNGNQIICTNEHEFYVNGTWIKAGELAKRTLETRKRDKRPILHKFNGSIINSICFWRKPSWNNEASIRWQWIFKNCHIERRQKEVEYNKNAQVSCGGIYSEPPKQIRSKSSKWNKDGQQGIKFRLVYSFGKLYTCIQDGVRIKCRQSTSKTYTNRGDCSEGKRNEKRGHDIQGNRDAFRIQEMYYRGLLHQELVAREISIDDIRTCEYTDCHVVYDLEVKDNHNYCITGDNIIVHNSGKTHLGGILSYNFIIKFPDIKGGIFANTFDQLNTSTLFRIREYWASIGVTEWNKDNPSGQYVSGREPPANWTKCRRNFDRFNNIISFCNGGLIFTGSLDNYFSHSGKEMGWCLLDETKDTAEEALKEVIITRLRQPGMYIVNGEATNEGLQSQQWNPLYCLTSPAKTDWLGDLFQLDKYVEEIAEKIYSRDTFFNKDADNKKVVISSTYHNIHNVGENYINSIFATNSEERARALVYGNPFSVLGGEFYSSFKRLEHVEPCKYDPKKPIHITFDQNSVPYNSAVIAQFENKDGVWYVYYIDEITLENPRNSTEEVCEEFMMRYPNHKAGVYYYGDASGHARTTMNKEFKHHYEVIEFKLRKYLVAGSDRTLISNPLILKRRDFINRIFENKLPIRIRVDESCKHAINDFMYCKQAVDGTKDKHIVTDKLTGDKYQKYGHVSDAIEYQIVEAFRNYYGT